MTGTLAIRKAYAKKIPWVRWSAVAAQCEGWHGGTFGKRSCKNSAHWTFRHSKKNFVNPGETRKYCWNHLFSRGLYGDMNEEARLVKWMERNPPPWKVQQATNQ